MCRPQIPHDEAGGAQVVNCSFSAGNAMQSVPEDQRDHLFISYATEDIALAEWLTYRLTAAGYRVWCDRIKLLGGESYPEDIDNAIKNRTFRFLGLVSHASLRKPNPRKERTTAHNIARERQVDYHSIESRAEGHRTRLDDIGSDIHRLLTQLGSRFRATPQSSSESRRAMLPRRW